MRPSALVALALALTFGACAAGEPRQDLADLTNPRLGPDYSQWLVGPIARMATAEERAAYLAAASDEEAARAIAEFWRRRDPDPASPGNRARGEFERRAREADRIFSEAGYLGRRTDRGALFILYGPPQKTEYGSPAPGSPLREQWTYDASAPLGLDGLRPKARYEFQKKGDLTELVGSGGAVPAGRPTPPPSDWQETPPP